MTPPRPPRLGTRSIYTVTSVLVALLAIFAFSLYNPRTRVESEAPPSPISTPEEPPALDKMATRLAPLVVNGARSTTATVIFIHGLGDTGMGWKPVAEMWSMQRMKHVKFILPNAPKIPITCNGGFVMPGWFDIVVLGSAASQDEKGMLVTREYLSELIQKEINDGTPAERIILGGFSQGGAMTLLTTLTTKFNLAGAVVMSGWLPLSDRLKEVGLVEEQLKTPVFMGHGDQDQIVQLSRNQESYEALQKLGANVQRKVYRGLPHSANDEELSDVANFILSKIPETS